ncbi:hypothetical protein MP228_010933 [Amoeboaphelidium protococcarum]|nr:hypothetical protein MP228_010933 [Amoeboaphelidium protococcarum]
MLLNLLLTVPEESIARYLRPQDLFQLSKTCHGMQEFVQSHRAFVKYCYHSYYGPAMTAYKIQNHNFLRLKSEEDYAWFMVPSVMSRSELKAFVSENSFAQKDRPAWFAAFNTCIDQALEDGHDSIEPTGCDCNNTVLVQFIVAFLKFKFNGQEFNRAPFQKYGHLFDKLPDLFYAELYRLYRNQNADDAVKMFEQEFNIIISEKGKDNYLAVYGEAPDYYDPPEDTQQYWNDLRSQCGALRRIGHQTEEEFSKEVAESVSELLTDGNYHEEVAEVLLADLAVMYRQTKELLSFGIKAVNDLFFLIEKKVRSLNVPDAWNYNGMKLKEGYRAQILLDQKIASEIELAGFESVREAVKHFLLDEQFGRDEDEEDVENYEDCMDDDEDYGDENASSGHMEEFRISLAVAFLGFFKQFDSKDNMAYEMLQNALHQGQKKRAVSIVYNMALHKKCTLDNDLKFYPIVQLAQCWSKCKSTAWDVVVIHCDLDAFYAQVEHVRTGISRDLPLAVQQWQGLIAVNYKARDFGINRHMRIQEAKEKCPDLQLVHVATFKKGESVYRYRDQYSVGNDAGSTIEQVDPFKYKVSLDQYRRESKKILQLINSEFDKVEKASIDEVFIDASNSTLFSDITALEDERENDGGYHEITTDMMYEHLQSLIHRYNIRLINECGLRQFDIEFLQKYVSEAIKAALLKQLIWDKLQYTISIGVSGNKLLSKLCSSLNKPDCVSLFIPPQSSLSGVDGVNFEDLDTFLGDIGISKVRNLGGKVANVLQTRDILTLGQLRQKSSDEIRNMLAAAIPEKQLEYLLGVLKGQCNDEVNPRMGNKSFLSAKSLTRSPYTTIVDLQQWLVVLCGELTYRCLDEYELTCRWPKTFTLTVSYSEKDLSDHPIQQWKQQSGGSNDSLKADDNEEDDLDESGGDMDMAVERKAFNVNSRDYNKHFTAPHPKEIERKLYPMISSALLSEFQGSAQKFRFLWIGLKAINFFHMPKTGIDSFFGKTPSQTPAKSNVYGGVLNTPLEQKRQSSYMQQQTPIMNADTPDGAYQEFGLGEDSSNTPGMTAGVNMVAMKENIGSSVSFNDSVEEANGDDNEFQFDLTADNYADYSEADLIKLGAENSRSLNNGGSDDVIVVWEENDCEGDSNPGSKFHDSRYKTNSADLEEEDVDTDVRFPTHKCEECGDVLVLIDDKVLEEHRDYHVAQSFQDMEKQSRCKSLQQMHDQKVGSRKNLKASILLPQKALSSSASKKQRRF